MAWQGWNVLYRVMSVCLSFRTGVTVEGVDCGVAARVRRRRHVIGINLDDLVK